MLTIENEESHASNMTFEDLFKQYYAYAVKQIIWIVKDQSIAEELAQEVFYNYIVAIGKELKIYLDG